MNPIPDHLKHFFADKEKLRHAVSEANKKTGFVPDMSYSDLTVTQREEQRASLRNSMRNGGIRAEDNVFTCLLYKMRDGEDDTE